MRAACPGPSTLLATLSPSIKAGNPFALGMLTLAASAGPSQQLLVLARARYDEN